MVQVLRREAMIPFSGRVWPAENKKNKRKILELVSIHAIDPNRVCSFVANFNYDWTETRRILPAV